MYNSGDSVTIDNYREMEGARINILGNELTIWISYFSPTEEEVLYFNTGKIELAVLHGLGMVVFGYKIDGSPWNSVCYSYQYIKYLAEDKQDIFIEPTIEDLKEDEPLFLKMYLVNTISREVLGKRVLKLTAEMKAEVVAGLKYQKYEKVPLLESNSDEAKLELFHMVEDFVENQDFDEMVKNFKRCIYE